MQNSWTMDIKQNVRYHTKITNKFLNKIILTNFAEIKKNGRLAAIFSIIADIKSKMVTGNHFVSIFLIIPESSNDKLACVIRVNRSKVCWSISNLKWLIGGNGGLFSCSFLFLVIIIIIIIVIILIINIIIIASTVLFSFFFFFIVVSSVVIIVVIIILAIYIAPLDSRPL